jgi:hypothetical protein
MESRRRLKESEVQQAQVVLASQDMVDQVQKMSEQISAMQFKDLPALTDSIKNDMGVDQATAYQSAAAAALTQLLSSVQQGKTALEGAQGTLTGQAPVVPGEDPAADMGMPPEGGDELNPDADMDVPPEGGDEGGNEGGKAGRQARGSQVAQEGHQPGAFKVIESAGSQTWQSDLAGGEAARQGHRRSCTVSGRSQRSTARQTLSR